MTLVFAKICAKILIIKLRLNEYFFHFYASAMIVFWKFLVIKFSQF